jgi:TetR/AcrR family transcriptional repressor of nem operon
MGRVSNAKERLMDAVLELIWTGSYGNTTIDQICEKAAVKKGSFYYFFDSKADLAAQAIETKWRLKRAELDAIFSATVPPLVRLRRFCDSSLHFQNEMKSRYGRVLGCPIFTLGAEVCIRDNGLSRKVRQLLADQCKYIESAIRDAHASGAIHAPDARAKALMLLAYCDGMLTQARIQNDVTVLRDTVRGMFAMLGVKAKQPPIPSTKFIPTK